VHLRAVLNEFDRQTHDFVSQSTHGREKEADENGQAAKDAAVSNVQKGILSARTARASRSVSAPEANTSMKKKPSDVDRDLLLLWTAKELLVKNPNTLHATLTARLRRKFRSLKSPDAEALIEKAADCIKKQIIIPRPTPNPRFTWTWEEFVSGFVPKDSLKPPK
jgi:hypothetical protein